MCRCPLHCECARRPESSSVRSCTSEVGARTLVRRAFLWRHPARQDRKEFVRPLASNLRTHHPFMTERSRTTVAGFDLIDVACVVVAVAVGVAVASHQHNAFRTVAAVAFSMFVPGRAIVSNWPSMAVRPQVALSILFSLAVLTLLATLTLWVGYWRPLGLLEVECVGFGVALLVGLVRRRRGQEGPDAIAHAELADSSESDA